MADEGIVDIDLPLPLEEPDQQRRKKRDPFASEHISSDEVLHQRRELATRGDIKRIQKAGVRHQGKKVVTDDVKKLKSLSVDPGIPDLDRIHYYVEPVRIEYYVPKDSRFVVETRYLYIPLVDPEPSERYPLLTSYMEKTKFFDIIEVVNEHSRYTTLILGSYHETFTMLENISRAVKDGRFNPESYRKAFYLTEAMMKFEPTVASLEVLGDYISYNINWLIRRMNSLHVEIAASDDTIAYLIKRRNILWEEKGLPEDERFEILAALFYDQAFPNRGLEFEEEDYFFDIFDRKSKY
jgi:hypothetical protein